MGARGAMSGGAGPVDGRGPAALKSGLKSGVTSGAEAGALRSHGVSGSALAVLAAVAAEVVAAHGGAATASAAMLPSVVAGWNMNAIDPAAGDGTIGASVGNGWCDHRAFGTGASALLGTTLGALEGEAAGESLSLAGSTHNGSALVFAFDTTGYRDLSLSFAVRRSSTGFAQSRIEYWTGFTWSAVEFFDAATTGWEVRTVDLSKYGALEDGGASLRFVVDGATSGSGSIRFDNVVVSGSMVPAPGAAVLAIAGLGLASRRRR
jgi:hypothetical protein